MALACSTILRASTRVGLARATIFRASPLLRPATNALPRFSPAIFTAQRMPDLSTREQSTATATTTVNVLVDKEVEKDQGESAAAASAVNARAKASVVALGARFGTTAEVMVSKIFPAGFGWQTGSLVADQSLGLGADTLGFALCTGLGDFTGVLLGHSLFYGIKDGGANFGRHVQTASWLGTAAFMAGTAWQPSVNILASLGFNACAVGTGAITGAIFFVGLRLGRAVYSNFMPAIGIGTGANRVADGQLSVAIGGGTACFVGTDVSFGDANWLRPLVGVEETTGDLLGCVKAGTSTFLGFGVVQAAENVLIPASSCWTDP